MSTTWFFLPPLTDFRFHQFNSTVQIQISLLFISSSFTSFSSGTAVGLPSTSHSKINGALEQWLLLACCGSEVGKGKPQLTKTDEFLENFQRGGRGSFPIQKISLQICLVILRGNFEKRPSAFGDLSAASAIIATNTTTAMASSVVALSLTVFEL